MAETTTPISRAMRPEVARARIAAFRKRFKEPHYIFAQHAAFPLALTPDLLYRLWSSFQRNIADQRLGIPWVAVADLLLSPLCEEVDVAYELYEIDVTVRDQLLNDLRANPHFGPQRIEELAYFLENYVHEQLKSSDPTLLDLAQSQRWTALAYIRPEQTAQELAETVKIHYNNSSLEQVRVASLLETLGKLAAPLARQQGFLSLLTYAQHQAHTILGNEQFTETPVHIQQATTQVAQSLGVTLPVARETGQASYANPANPAASPPQQSDTRSDFYISHHIDDHESANWIARQLHAAGYTVTWAFEFGPASTIEIDTRSIRAQARYTLALLSPAYLNVENVHNEWTAILDQSQVEEKRLLLPIRVRDCTPQGIFASLQYLDLVGKSDNIANAMLLDFIHQFLNEPVNKPVHKSIEPPDIRDTIVHISKEAANKPLQVFIAYARHDQSWAEELKRHLSILVRQGLISTWDYQNVAIGADWKKEIQAHLDSAAIILLLVSPDFLASDYSSSVEVRRAMERHERGEALVVPVLLRAATLDGTLFKNVQMLPGNYQPIVSWPDRDAAFNDVVDELKSAVEALRASELPVSDRDEESKIQELESRVQTSQDEAAYIELGNLYESLKRNAEAIQAYERALSLQPGDVSVIFAVSLLYNDVGEYDKAIEYLNQLVTERPDFAEAYKELGLAYRRRADTAYARGGEEEMRAAEYGKALEYLLRAVELRPDFEDALGSLGGVYRRLGAYQRALEYYQRLYAVNPNSSYALGNLGSLSWYLGKTGEAHTYFQVLEQVAAARIREQRDEAYWDYYDLALAQLVAGKLADAQETYARAIGDTPAIVQFDAVLNNLYLLQRAPTLISGLGEIIAMLENAKDVMDASDEGR
ncbi:MAG: hypothetical protein NVS2B12_21440 [Ktedonobacteraceae bacterium]